MRSGYEILPVLETSEQGVRVLVPAVVEAWTKPHAPDTSVDVRETRTPFYGKQHRLVSSRRL